MYKNRNEIIWNAEEITEYLLTCHRDWYDKILREMTAE